MRFIFLLLTSTALCFIPFLAFAQGGPPLLTDDPDPPGDGHWEINIAATLQSSAGAQSYELPHVDLNYGLGDSIQLKWETGLAAFGQSGSDLRFGWEDSLFGVKWRIKNGGDEGLTFGTYLQVGTRLLSSNDPALAGPTRYAILPIEIKYGMGRLALDTEVGALLSANAASGWMYGLCGGYNVTALVELTAEIHGTLGNPVIFPAGLIAQIGTRAGFNEHIAIIASIGRTVVVPAGASSTFLMFLGTRLLL